MRRRIQRVTPYVPTASMGDIAFLLIIFFMVCSNFMKEASIQLSPPKADELSKMEESPVSVSIDEDGVMYLQGSRIFDEEQLEWGVMSLIKDKASEKGRTVLFKCDEAVTSDVFEPAMDAISRAGGIIAAMGEKINKEKETP